MTVAAIFKGRDRQLNPYCAALASHYRFAPMFCMPARGQEKSDVERAVYALERRFATPVPKVQDLDELNRHLLGSCLRERGRTVSGRSCGGTRLDAFSSPKGRPQRDSGPLRSIQTKICFSVFLFSVLAGGSFLLLLLV